MTGREVYQRAVALLGQEETDVGYYPALALVCLNQMLADCLGEQNALDQAFGKHSFVTAPELLELEDEVPYHERMVSECFPYRLAALLVAGEDRKEYNRLTQEYEERLAKYSPCCLIEMRGTG
ncbi:MAG: hypothetical protein Q4F79_07345 [Eubacteriales bacterium]|nr:hypothetical protein [Eubacteriales bacterium]